MAEKAKTTKKTTKTTIKKTTAKKPATSKASSAKISSVKTPKEVKSTKSPKTEAQKPVRKNKTGLIIGIILAILAVAAAACIAVYFYLANSIAMLVGNYDLTGMSSEGEDQSSSIKVLEGLGLSATMELKKDGTGTMNLFGKESTITFDRNKIRINDQDMPFTYEDGKITFTEDNASLTFTKK